MTSLPKETIRAFIAFPFSNNTLQALEETQHYLKPFRSHVNWVKTSNIHLTLKFLGNVTQIQIDEIALQLESLLCKTPSIATKLMNVGAFPHWHRAKIIWIGLDDHQHHLQTLAKNIDEVCKKSGVPAENRFFAPHITIGRIKEQSNLSQLEKAANNYKISYEQEIIFDEFILFQSTLTSAGPIYQKIKSFKLSTVIA